VRAWAVRAAVLAAILAVSLPLSAGWWEAWRGDMCFDLEAAREQALAAIAENPSSADAVAAAMWWLANVENLPAPQEILSVTDNGRDPELGFILALIETRLRSEAPASVFKTAELAGPFGVFSSLDLERGVVPPDDGLPPLGTRWRKQGAAFRIAVRHPDGSLAPPMSMSVDGVYLFAWNLTASEALTGWLVVEAQGSYNLSVDGLDVDQRRDCGLDDPETNWYRIRLARGAHRLRVELASPGTSGVRVSVLDDRGGSLAAVRTSDQMSDLWTGAEVQWSLPPAEAALSKRLEDGGGSTADLLLAAQLARGRGDPMTEYGWIERVRDHDPESPWAALALARYELLENTDNRGAESLRRAAQLLREATVIPGSRLFERAVAVRESRTEDAEHLLDELMKSHGDDVRVLRIWVREAVRRGWAGEAEEGLARLETALPDSPSVMGLRLEVLSALERWREREMLLRALASESTIETRWIGQLSSSCLAVEAVAAARTLQGEIEDPDFDVQLVRLYLESGDLDTARSELEGARVRWGDLPVFDELMLVSAGGDPDTLQRAVAGALERDSSNLQLLTLAWRQGRVPFYAPFQVEARAFAAEHSDLGTDADAVLLLDQAVERIFPDGSSLYYYHGLTRANTPVGVRRASVLQPLPEAYLLKVRVLKPDGRQVVPSELRPGGGVISLNDVEPGDLVEEEYVARVAATGATRDGHLPPYIYRFADPDRAFGLSEYVLLVPPEIDLQVDGNFEGLEQSEQEWQGLRMLNWRAERVPPMPTEPFAPPAQDLMPWLNYGFGVTWQDVGDAVRDRVLPVLRTSPELREWSRPLLEGESAADELRALVTALIDTVEPGGGELAVGTAAADSFRRRRGNRLGILAAVLADAGWEVDLVLARAWTERGQRLGVPTLDAFPAALLRLESGGDELWVDIREESRGVNHINPIFQGSDGLVLPLTRPQTPVTLMEELPAFPNPDLEETVTVHAEISAEGDARIAFRMPLRGVQADRLLERVESVPVDQEGMIYRQLAVSLFAGASAVEGNIERSPDGAVIHLDMLVPHACEAENGELVCRSLVLAHPLVPMLASLPERNYPLVLRVPIERRLELDLVSAPGWEPVYYAPRRLEAQWGSVDEDLQNETGSLRSTLHIVLPAQTVATENYPTFARFCQAIDELSTRPPRLRRASDH